MIFVDIVAAMTGGWWGGRAKGVESGQWVAAWEGVEFGWGGGRALTAVCWAMGGSGTDGVDGADGADGRWG